MGDHIETFPAGTRTRTEVVAAFGWRCGECGWVGTGLSSEEAARREGERHVAEHGRCATDRGADGG